LRAVKADEHNVRQTATFPENIDTFEACSEIFFHRFTQIRTEKRKKSENGQFG